MRDDRPSKEFIEYICRLYGDIYDDRIEDSSPPAVGLGKKYRDAGKDWKPGQESKHKSLAAFQSELKELNIDISTTKIRKILITGGCWTTDMSREINSLFKEYTSSLLDGGKGLSNEKAVVKISEELNISRATVSINLEYQDVVYNLKNKSSNAKRCEKYRKHKDNGNSVSTLVVNNKSTEQQSNGIKK